MLPAKGSKRKLHIQLGDGFYIQFVPFDLSYLGTGKPAKTLYVTVWVMKINTIHTNNVYRSHLHT